jgi:ribosomal protein S18 acetylase RimI-like enzyme
MAVTEAHNKRTAGGDRTRAVILSEAGPEIQILAAAEAPAHVLWRAFVEGFEGYPQPTNLDEAEFAAMVAAEGIDPTVSRVAVDEAGRPAGVALLMVRGEECWCGGLGVVPSLRGRGLGRWLMEELVTAARERGLRRMRLEVIVGNSAACRLYDRLGFVPLRRLDIFKGLPAHPPTLDPTLAVASFPDPNTVWTDFDVYHPVPPSWQREPLAVQPTLGINPPSGLCLGDPTRPMAYLLTRPYDPDAPIGDTGMLPVRPDYAIAILDAGVRCDANDLGDPAAPLTVLVAHLIATHPGRTLVASNLPEDDPLNSVLHACGVPAPFAETEMTLDLRAKR